MDGAGSVARVAIRSRTGVEDLSMVMRQSPRIEADMEGRPHMARPSDSSGFDLLAINVPMTYQQGVIPDGEEPPWELLRIVSAARGLYGLNAGILDAHRLKLNEQQISEQLQKQA